MNLLCLNAHEPANELSDDCEFFVHGVGRVLHGEHLACKSEGGR